MSGSLVDQVNHALSLKQRTRWLTDCRLHNQHTELWETPRFSSHACTNLYGVRFKELLLIKLKYFFPTFCFDQTSISCQIALKPPFMAPVECPVLFATSSARAWQEKKQKKTTDDDVDKTMAAGGQGRPGQIITILPIWRDPSPDIGLNPRNNWCMQSQIGSRPKIWAYYFIRWSHILCARNYLCAQHTNSNPVRRDNV